MSAELFDEVTLVVDGQEHSGWQSVVISAQIDALSRYFELQMAYDERGDFPLVVPGTRCEIKVNGVLLITAFIDEVNGYKTAKNHSRGVIGRSITRNIVDSSIDLKTNQFTNLNPFEICQKIASPFGIEVINEAGGLKNIPILRWADAAKAGAVMQDACRQQGLTIRDNAQGQLVIRQPNLRRSRGAIAEASKDDNDANIEGWRIKRSEVQRHSQYIVKGKSSGNNGKPSNQKIGRAEDDGVDSYRPLIVQIESDVTNKKCEIRALHEAQKRIALSFPINATVTGWRNRLDGDPWEVDELVPVKIDSEGISETMLIRAFTMIKNDSGTTTKLDLVPPNAYTAQPTSSGGGKPKKAVFDRNNYIVDLGGSEKITDGAGIS